MNIKNATVVLLTIILVLGSHDMQAQRKKYKFGKISDEELYMKTYEKDSTANAVVLFDIGKSEIEGLHLNFVRHLRIKILKKEGVDQGNIHIELYKNGSDREEIYSLRGKTFNIEKGEVIETKLSGSTDVLEEEVTENLTMKKINFPAVKEGSIIDLTYMIRSDFLFNLQDWQFQFDIPVIYSKYSTLIPEFFVYHKNLRGYYPLNISESNETRSITNTAYVNYYSEWEVSDIPAFEKEPYITTKSDYISKLEFELESFQYPQQPIQNFSENWSQIDKKLTEHEFFGKKMTVDNQIKEIADELCMGIDDKSEKMMKLYSYVQEKFAWNNRNSEFSSKRLNKFLKEKSGNSGEINFFLLELLRSQGIVANPTILSTRANGKVYPSHPTLTAFNYMIVNVSIDGKEYYLDATDDDIPLGVLPFRCLNYYGRKFLNNASSPVKIIPAVKYESTKIYNVEIKEDEDLTGNAQYSYKGYAAIEKRKKIKEEGGQEPYIKGIQEKTKYSSIEEYKILNADDIYKPYKESYTFSSNDNIVFAGDMIYLDPFLHEKMESNPFKLEDRKYPVDYGYNTSETLIFRYLIPEGFTVTEVPKNISMSLPQKAASFQYQVSVIGQTIQIMSLFKINQPLFLNDSYAALKNFYNLVIEKQSEKIVLKKAE